MIEDIMKYFLYESEDITDYEFWEEISKRMM